MASLKLMLILSLSVSIKFITAENEYDSQNLRLFVQSTSADVENSYDSNRMLRPTKRQTQIVKKIEKAQEEQKKINEDLDKANVKLQQLLNQQTYSSNSPTSSATAVANKQKALAKEINKVKEKIDNLGLKAALSKTLLEQLKKQQSSTETSPDSTNNLTKIQKAINSKIIAARETKEELEMETALANTMLEELKKRQIYVTNGDGTTVVSSTDKSKKLASDINKFKDKQQELSLKLAMATTTLEQLEKQHSISPFPTDLTGLTAKQKTLSQKINSAWENKNSLEMETALANTFVEELRKQQVSYTANAGLFNNEDANKLKKLSSEISKNEEKKLDLNMKLSLATKLLEQLEKQWSSATTSPPTTVGLSSRQKAVSNKINNAKEDKENIELQLALTETLVDELKKQQNFIYTKANSDKNYENKLRRFASEINKGEEKKQELIMKLALTTKMLEELEKQLSASTSSPTSTAGMPGIQKSLINKINKAQEKKEDIELKATISKTLIEELQKQHNSIIASFGTGNNGYKKRLQKLTSNIAKAEKKTQQLGVKLLKATAELDKLKTELNTLSSTKAV